MTKMSSLNYMELCRLCLVKEKVSVPIFEGEGGERQIFDKIATCLPVKVSQDDKLPKKICSDCVYRVENSYQFWNTTSNSEKQLLEWVVNDDVKVDTKSNLTMETEQLVLKEETIDHDQTAADVAKSLSRVEAVLTEETGQPGGGVSEEEEEEEDSDDGGGGGGGEDSNSEESGEEPPGKEEIESEEEEEEEEPYEELEPTTFVNVSLACDEAGPSGIQQTRQQTKQDSQASAASASATTENAEAPSTSAADPAASGFTNEIPFNNAWLNFYQDIKPFVNIYSNFNKTATSILSERRNGGSVKCSKNTDPHKISIPRNLTEKVSCELCGKSYFSKKRLDSHFRQHGYMCSCSVCGMNFKNRKSLKLHSAVHHKEFKYFCDHCNFVTYRKSYLRMHCKNHTSNFSHFCDVCHKGFRNKASLLEHKLVHTGLKPYLCDNCGESFTTNQRLKVHKLRHDADHRPELIQCGVCQRLFTFRNSLKRHMAQHTGNMPKFVCEVCGKVLTSSPSLRVHERTHSGEKPFGCKVCGKAFGGKTYLRVHMRTHTGERPYSCDLCGKTFTQRSCLWGHTKRYHLSKITN